MQQAPHRVQENERPSRYQGESERGGVMASSYERRTARICREILWQFINLGRPRQSSPGSNLLKSLGLCDMVGNTVSLASTGPWGGPEADMIDVPETVLPLERALPLKAPTASPDNRNSGGLREARPT